MFMSRLAGHGVKKCAGAAGALHLQSCVRHHTAPNEKQGCG